MNDEIEPIKAIAESVAASQDKPTILKWAGLNGSECTLSVKPEQDYAVRMSVYFQDPGIAHLRAEPIEILTQSMPNDDLEEGLGNIQRALRLAQRKYKNFVIPEKLRFEPVSGKLELGETASPSNLSGVKI